MLQKTIKHLYLCEGRPDCFGHDGCALIGIGGYCSHTTDISYAINRVKLLTDAGYMEKHMQKIADSDWEEVYEEYE